MIKFLILFFMFILLYRSKKYLSEFQECIILVILLKMMYTMRKYLSLYCAVLKEMYYFVKSYWKKTIKKWLY